MDVKTIAREKGMKMEEIAQRLEITKGGLSKALNGNPTLKTLRAVADVLGVSVTELFRDEQTDGGFGSAGSPQAGQQPQAVCQHCGKPIVLGKGESC